MKSAVVFVFVASLLITACAQASTPAPAQAPAPVPAAKGPEPAVAKASKPVAKQLEKVNVQIPAFSDTVLPLLIGKAKGIFQEEGLDPEPIQLKGDLAVPALLKGDVDYLDTFGRPMQAGMMGEPVRLLMVTLGRPTWHIVLAPGLKSADQIRGKAVAINMKGGLAENVMNTGLRKLGLDPAKDLTTIIIPNDSDILLALKAGSAAAANLETASSKDAVALGGTDILFTGDASDIPGGGMATSLKRMQENPGQVKRMIRAYLKSMAYARDHKDEAVAVAVEQLKVSKPAAEAVLTDHIKVWSYDGILTDKALTAFFEMSKASGGKWTDATLDRTRNAVDQTLLKEALKELGLSK